jgi:hypothetical protein
MDLFAVLAEVEGTGVLLAYCLVDGKSAEKKARSDPAAMTSIIQQFFGRLKDFGGALRLIRARQKFQQSLLYGLVSKFSFATSI